MPGLNDSLYAESGAQTVAAAAQIPLTLSNATANTVMSVSNNAVVLPAGTYLVSFGGTGTPSTGNETGVQLYVNGSALAYGTLTTYATATVSGNVGKTLVLTVTSAGTLTLFNPTDDSVVYSDAYITASKLTT